jgi:hypothetical protein
MPRRSGRFTHGVLGGAVADHHHSAGLAVQELVADALKLEGRR